MVKELDFSVNLEGLLEDYKLALSSLRWTDTRPTFQSGVQVCSAYPDDELMACGSTHNLHIQEHEFSILHPKYLSSYVARLVQQLPLKVTRLRWLRLEGKSCYSFHKDLTPRLHIPIFTSAEAFFLFKEPAQIFHLDLGKVYIVDTTHTHTALNTGNEDRVHLVGCLCE